MSKSNPAFCDSLTGGASEADSSSSLPLTNTRKRLPTRSNRIGPWADLVIRTLPSRPGSPAKSESGLERIPRAASSSFAEIARSSNSRSKSSSSSAIPSGPSKASSSASSQSESILIKFVQASWFLHVTKITTRYSLSVALLVSASLSPTDAKTFSKPITALRYKRWNALLWLFQAPTLYNPSTMSMPLRISADEINCLIYSYFQDSGLQHSAFLLLKEGNLDRSPYFAKHIRRGELVDLLSKALLYVEVEAHWEDESLAKNCKTGFSLLDVHTCSLESDAAATAERHNDALDSSGFKLQSNVKRKASTASMEDGRSDKRAKAEHDGREVDDGPSESQELPVPYSNPASKAKFPDIIKPPSMKDSSKKAMMTDDVSDSDVVRLLQGHTAEIFVCAWNPARPELLATGSKDAAVNIWDLPPVSGPTPPLDPAALCSRNYFASSEQGDFTALDWNMDGSLLAIASYDSTLRICTASGGLYFSNGQHQGPIFAVRFSKTGHWLLTASLDGTACIWDVQGKQLHYQYRCHTDCCLDIDWLDENTFASCGADMQIHIMRLGETKPIKTLSGHGNEINQIKCDPSQTRLASCSDDQTARIWNIVNWLKETPDPSASDSVVILRGHKHSVSSIQWCPTYVHGSVELVASSSFDGTSRLWNSVTGDCLKIFSDHKRPVYALAFSPDGQCLATGSGDGWLHIYTVADKEKKWSWFAGPDRPGVFEIDWQKSGNTNRIALALECRQVGIVDVSRVPSLQV